MVEEQAAGTTKRRRGRSPSYPAIDLKIALQRSYALYEIERNHATPVETILAHWGYKPTSGKGLVALAALKKFGLLIDEGSAKARKARLSDDAIKIALDTRPETGDRYKALQKAALMPTIHLEIWNKYGASLPSEANLRYELVTERGFTEAGADEFIPQYKRTLAFAHMQDNGKLSVDDEDKDGQGEGIMTPPATLTDPPPTPLTPTDTAKRESRVVQLPISATEWAALQAPFPLTEVEWKRMDEVLKAMKPALSVASAEPNKEHTKSSEE